MIPDIGLMIGLYIVTRMIVIMFDKSHRTAPKIFSGITILVALFCLIDLMSRGSSIPTNF